MGKRQPEDMACFTYSNFIQQAFLTVLEMPKFVFFER
jgi:hypothetical protein